MAGGKNNFSNVSSGKSGLSDNVSFGTGGMNDIPSVKKVHANQDSPMRNGVSSGSGSSGGRGKGGLLDRLRGGIRDLMGLGSKGLVNGVRGLKDSAFGLKKPAKRISDGVGSIASYLSIPKKAVAGTLIVSLLVGGGAGIVALNNNSYVNFMAQQEFFEDPCIEEVENLDTIKISTDDADERMMEVATKVWGLCKYLGWTDESAAGLLGCMQAESHVDPAKIEGGLTNFGKTADDWVALNQAWPESMCRYCEEHIFGTDPSKCGYTEWGISADENDSHVVNGVFITSCDCHRRVPLRPSKNDNGLNISIYGGAPDGHFYCGIGLIQGTGGRAYHLYNYAKSGGRNWWDLDVQMAFLIDDTGGDGKDRVDFMWCNRGPDHYKYRSWGGAGWDAFAYDKLPNDVDDLSIAVQQVGLDLVGGRYKPGDKQYNRRYEAAQEWYSRLAGTRGDTSFALSVVALAGMLDKEAASTAIKDVVQECGVEDAEFDNSDIARAAVAYAYEWRHKSSVYNHGCEHGNSGHDAERSGCKGTDLYQFVHDNVHDGEKKSYYVGCDIGVTTAVRWCDADVNFPHAGPEQIISYCKSHPDKWEDLGEYGVGVKFDDLEPGDVFSVGAKERKGQFAGCGHGHVAMYTGNELIMEKFGEDKESYYWVAASIYGHAPNIQASHYPGGTATDMGYHVFRLKEGAGYEEVKYRNVTDGATELDALSGYVTRELYNKNVCTDCEKARQKADRGDYNQFLH